ncbi:MAG: hypothetical protein F6J89_20000 [Symploca sp. SIO1C4]|uniref:Uncharacterized protein n=1 Tax=Symploca sp. SIO1C4 TaxID=2607765 RepID=A0A6B3NG09_9CYAN|nr:hypothetical protein [Symploca sp. SIO1C4]
MTRAMLTEEPNEAKVSRWVLKPSQKGDPSGLGQPTADQEAIMLNWLELLPRHHNHKSLNNR